MGVSAIGFCANPLGIGLIEFSLTYSFCFTQFLLKLAENKKYFIMKRKEVKIFHYPDNPSGKLPGNKGTGESFINEKRGVETQIFFN